MLAFFRIFVGNCRGPRFTDFRAWVRILHPVQLILFYKLQAVALIYIEVDNIARKECFQTFFGFRIRLLPGNSINVKTGQQHRSKKVNNKGHKGLTAKIKRSKTVCSKHSHTQ